MIVGKKRGIVLLLGDIFLFYISLLATIFIAYATVFPVGVFFEHFVSFSILIIIWILVFFISGLYNKETLFFKKKLSSVILNVQIINSIIAVIFFYSVSYFDITPKTNLFIYLIISFPLILLWRQYGIDFLRSSKKQKVLLVGSGTTLQDLKEELGNNSHYQMTVSASLDLASLGSPQSKQTIVEAVETKGVAIVIIDMHDERIESVLPHLYNLLFSHVQFLDMHKVYEEIFDRIPLTLIDYKWFLENVSFRGQGGYDFLKRGMDIVAGLVLGVLSLVVYPFVFIAIFLDDRGKIFIRQRRIGKDNKIVKLLKFRTMDFDDDGNVLVKIGL